MKIESICFVVLVIFALFGLLFFSALVHELIHMNDLHEFAEDEEIHLLNIPLTAEHWYDYVLEITGTYSFFPTDRIEVEKRMISTEIKAYSIQIIIIILAMACFGVVSIKRKLNMERIYIYD